jgi:hypothetical protein
LSLCVFESLSRSPAFTRKVSTHLSKSSTRTALTLRFGVQPLEADRKRSAQVARVQVGRIAPSLSDL